MVEWDLVGSGILIKGGESPVAVHNAVHNVYNAVLFVCFNHGQKIIYFMPTLA